MAQRQRISIVFPVEASRARTSTHLVAGTVTEVQRSRGKEGVAKDTYDSSYRIRATTDTTGMYVDIKLYLSGVLLHLKRFVSS